MKRIIDVKFDFTKNAEIVDWNAEEIQEYRRVFKRDVVPEMAAIERRKIKAIELAYKIRCGTFCSMKLGGCERK